MSCKLTEIEETLLMLGVKGACSQELYNQAEQAVQRIKSVAVPRYVYGIFDIEHKQNSVELKGCSLSLEGSDICEHLRGSEKCALMATTLGAGVDTELMRLQSTNMSLAVVADSAAGVVADRLADECEEQIRRLAQEQGYTLTYRYSPGYGNFSIECQPHFLRVLNCGVRLGLTATKSCMLLPTKSITAVIGLIAE